MERPPRGCARRIQSDEGRSFAFRLAAGVAFVDDHVAHAEAAAIDAFAAALGIESEESEMILREVQEELGQSITDLRLLGTLESLFIYNGKSGHEIVQVYDASFTDPSVYRHAQIKGHESDGAPFTVRWHDSSSFSEQAPLVPKGLGDLLKSAGLLD